MAASTAAAALRLSRTAFPPDPDEGQPGMVLLPDGRYGYRYKDSDDVIVLKQRETENE